MPRYVAGRRPRAAASTVNEYVGRLASAHFDTEELTIDHHGRDNDAPGLNLQRIRRIPLGAIDDVELSADRYGLPLVLVHVRGRDRTPPAFMHRNVFVVDRAVPAAPFVSSVMRAASSAPKVTNFDIGAQASAPSKRGRFGESPLLDWMQGW